MSGSPSYVILHVKIIYQGQPSRSFIKVICRGHTKKVENAKLIIIIGFEEGIVEYEAYAKYDSSDDDAGYVNPQRCSSQ